MIDFSLSCQRTADLLANVTDDDLAAPTPCANFSVGDVVHHVGGLALAFAAAACKDRGPLTGPPPSVDAAQLDPYWRTRYPERLTELAQAWADPSAWQGMSRIAAMDMPGEAVGLVALTEVVIHGWDLARATGHAYDVDPAVADAVLANVAQFAAQGPVEGLFDAAVPVADDAPVLDRIVALSGRDPGWRA
ncbi:TIGR03086 family metal-binding protein [Mycobacterium sp. MMS18-G62]